MRMGGVRSVERRDAPANLDGRKGVRLCDAGTGRLGCVAPGVERKRVSVDF